jgi:uncharacterized membrane protein YsdA (DUF1294 family)
MTLQEFLEQCSANPSFIIMYFFTLPIASLLAWWLGKDEAKESPWKFMYSALMFMACIPGIFAITLNVYLFLFEKRSIFEADIYSQILPILSMIATLFIIRKNTCFEDIPGFQKLGGLLMVLGAILSIMWFLEKTRIVIFSYMPFYYVLIILAVLLIAIRFGTKKLFS